MIVICGKTVRDRYVVTMKHLCDVNARLSEYAHKFDFLDDLEGVISRSGK